MDVCTPYSYSQVCARLPEPLSFFSDHCNPKCASRSFLSTGQYTAAAPRASHLSYTVLPFYQLRHAKHPTPHIFQRWVSPSSQPTPRLSHRHLGPLPSTCHRLRLMPRACYFQTFGPCTLVCAPFVMVCTLATAWTNLYRTCRLLGNLRSSTSP